MKVFKRTFSASGFTLVEVMIYIALFGVLIGGAVVSAYQVLAGGAHNQQAVEVQQEGAFIDRKINWEVAQANTASIVSGALALDSGNVVIQESAGRITLKRASGAAFPLSAESFVVTNAVFTVTPGTGGGPTSVRASFLINDVPFTFARYLRE